MKVTSKHQITLPAEFVRKLHISKHDRLMVQLDGDKLVLRPQMELMERMQRHWRWQSEKAAAKAAQRNAPEPKERT